jgi:hypothetical protein
MNQILLRVLLAALPLLGLALDPGNALFFGGAATGIFMAAIVIFFLIHCLIPESLARVSFLLILLCLVILGTSLFNLPFAYAGSLCVLTPVDLFRARRDWLRISTKGLWAGFGFFTVLTAQGLFAEGIGSLTGFQFFSSPAGSYFLVGLGLALAPGSERRGRSRGLVRGRRRRKRGGR